ncbi:MAG: SsrA-binding protein SmpB [Melioribacteraceae bacterium]|nr:SsrA-binding protein SmpB [Melioribacteraceae bacterium]MCF8355182.1 SsrA-binding protein SmpB [Melioribacteraceae bacterium]MCF8395395.1 SsrA-binding protein SmpB [Melioribacteraceae bacterium]MCF8419899.1 SsrA-binding protein SmpB [Melioribacteraceae bacterium]
MPETEEKNITVNRKARHEYHIIQVYEAGISLLGSEVKSLREHNANLTDAYASIGNGEVILKNAHIGTYKQANINNHEPLRERRLLLRKSEIRKLIKFTEEKGNTLIPLRLYFRKGLVKVELAVAKGKKTYDKRQDIAKKDFQRQQERKISY